MSFSCQFIIPFMAVYSLSAIVLRGGPIFRTGFSILSAKGFRWVGGGFQKPVWKDFLISKTRPLKEKDSGMGGWGPRNPFAERIEKPVRNIGPPLMLWVPHYWSWEESREIYYFVLLSIDTVCLISHCQTAPLRNLCLKPCQLMACLRFGKQTLFMVVHPTGHELTWFTTKVLKWSCF